MFGGGKTIPSKAKNKLYETEQLLGLLPENWERGQTDEGRLYFVDHTNKTTTWIDPRTKKTRKMDISQISKYELPYGWEEAYDEGCGLYYIDHNTQSTYMDPPWDKRVQEHYRALREHLLKETRRLEQRKVLHQQSSNQLNKARIRATELESAKSKLQEQLQQILRDTESTSSLLSSPAVAQIQADVELIKTWLTAEKSEISRIAQEFEKLSTGISAFQSNLDDLKALNDKLINSESSSESTITGKDIQEVKKLLEIEASQRESLEKNVMKLKADILELVKSQDNRRSVMGGLPKSNTAADIQAIDVVEQKQIDVEDEDSSEDELSDMNLVRTQQQIPVEDLLSSTVEDAPIVEMSIPDGARSNTVKEEYEVGQQYLYGAADLTPEQRQKRMHLEMELELLALKKLLQQRQRDKQRLGSVSVETQAQKDRLAAKLGNIPDWIKKLNSYAATSATVRLEIGKAQKNNPDQLSFAEKMLFFTATALESKSSSKLSK